MTPRNTNTGGVLEAMILPALTRGGYGCAKQIRIGTRCGGGVHKVDAVAEKNGQQTLVSLKWQQTGRAEFGGATASGVETQDLQGLAARVAERAPQVERAIEAALAVGSVPANAQAINDGMARLEQTLVDASEPADKRWFRHVVYGWNIYSMYDGQPLPDLAEAIRVNDLAVIEREQARIRRALERMRDGVESLAGLAGADAAAMR